MLRDIDQELIDVVNNEKEAEVCRCIANGANVNVKNPQRWNETPLHRAAQLGSDKLCKILLKAGAKVGCLDENGRTPLHVASESDFPNCCRLLLEAGATADLSDENGWTPLHKASDKGADRCVRICLDAGARVDLLNAQAKDESSLHLASASGSVKCCQILLNSGATLDLHDKDGWTPLHHAADSDKCSRLLVSAGAELQSVDKLNWTPLHWASYRGSDKCCKMFLDFGAVVDSVDKKDQTPLHKAAQSGNDKCCKILLGAGAKVDSSDRFGCTPLHLASESDSTNCCRVLIGAGSKIDPLDQLGRNPLYSAACAGSFKSCKLLVEAGARVDLHTKYGWSPLHAAAQGGSAKCSKVILDAGASVNAVKKRAGGTALHIACRNFYDFGGEDYCTVITTLFRAGADVSIKDKRGRTAIDLLQNSYKGGLMQQEYERTSLHRRLMSAGGHPVDVVKIFLCGNPSAGKTTLKNTLTKKLSILTAMKGIFVRSAEKGDKDGDYTKTPGIEVAKESVKGVGQFTIWDCAGQIEYSVTHGMFLGSAQAIFVVIYSILELLAGDMSTSKFWLPFIKATRALEEIPKVILVATHSDKIHDQKIGLQASKELLRQSKTKFSGVLDIDEELILLDARDENSDGMEQLKTVLRNRRKEIVGTDVLPKLCDKLRKLIKPWRDEPVPVLSWEQFLYRVKESYAGMDEDTLRAVTAYLHIMGDVYWAKFEGKDDQLIINTQWFTTNIIGRAYAGVDFVHQLQHLLPNQPLYSLSQLRNFFTDQMDTVQLLALLEHMDLVHATRDGMYLIPGKLPLHGEQVVWNVQEAYAVKGISVVCVNDIDIFNPSVFPSVQKKILDERKGATVISRTAVKCTMASVEVFVQLSKHKDAISVAVLCRDEKSLRDAYEYLENTVGLIEAELFRKSAGTRVQRCYISNVALQQSATLDNVWGYNEGSLVEAEQSDGLVRKDPSTRPEDVTKLVFQGYNNVVLRRLGAKCRYDWLPVDAAKRCFNRLDVIHEWREDYRSVARLLGVADYEVEQIVKRSESQHRSVTGDLIREWCDKTRTKMTIGMLRDLLDRMGLEDNTDALLAVEEVLERYPGQITKCREEDDTVSEASHDFGISDYLVTWRRVLKRKRAILLADMDPSSITSRLLYLPLSVCVVFEGTECRDVQQRVNNVKTLLMFLLEREEEDWPLDLVKGLEETDQGPMAQELQTKYLKIVGEEGRAQTQSQT